MLAAIAACQAAGELPAGPRDRSGHGRAAARSGARRCRDQRRAGAGQAGAAAAARDRRGARRAPAATCRRSRRVEIAKPGFVNLRLTDDFWRGQIRIALRAGARYGAADLGQGRTRQRRVLLGQPDRAAARRPRPRHGVRRRARQPAGEDGLARWCANTTSTTAAPRSTTSRARSTTATSRRSARRRPSRPRASIPATI